MINRIMHPLLAACTVSKSQINKLAFESMSTETEGKKNTFGVIRASVVMEIHVLNWPLSTLKKRVWTFGVEIPGLHIWPKCIPAE